MAKKALFKRTAISINRSNAINNYWVNTIGHDLFGCWQNTPWDFNGTADRPNNGPVACGYFVTGILKNMGCAINRTKLSTCTSLEMMHQLLPGKKVNNFSSMSLSQLNHQLSSSGKGVYIIGLDFHTGFIINDGNQNWFLHSNYIRRVGVTKELIENSSALKSSKTKWIIPLSQDTNFQNKWLSD